MTSDDLYNNKVDMITLEIYDFLDEDTPHSWFNAEL